MLLSVLTLLSAHPMSGAAGVMDPAAIPVGQQIEVVLTPEQVELRFMVEVPVARLMAEAKMEGGAGLAQRRLEELWGALRVQWEGEGLSLTRDPVADPTRIGDPGFALFELRGHAALPDDAGTLKISNGAYPDERCYFLTDAHISGRLMVVATDLVDVQAGQVHNNRNGAWRREEEARETKIQVRPASWWEQTHVVEPLPLRVDGTLSLAQLPNVRIAGGVGLAGLGVMLLTRLVHRSKR